MKYNVKRVLFFSVLLCSCFLVGGCKKHEETIVFDNTYPLALSPSVEWAVVKDPYAAFRKEPDWGADVVEHCRRGEILQVSGRSVDSKNEKWCSFEQGWLAESCLSIYSNRYKAERVSKILLQNEKK